jgi:hypothetical protein
MCSLFVLLWTELRRIEIVSCQNPMELVEFDSTCDDSPYGTPMDLVEFFY